MSNDLRIINFSEGKSPTTGQKADAKEIIILIIMIILSAGFHHFNKSIEILNQ